MEIIGSVLHNNCLTIKIIRLYFMGFDLGDLNHK